ncbi:MAG: hypothetical protein ACPGVY_14525 [Mycobacterium sp.]
MTTLTLGPLNPYAPPPGALALQQQAPNSITFATPSVSLPGGGLRLQRNPIAIIFGANVSARAAGSMSLVPQMRLPAGTIGLRFPTPPVVHRRDPIQVSRSDHRTGALHQRKRDDFVPQAFQCQWRFARYSMVTLVMEHYRVLFTQPFDFTPPGASTAVRVKYAGQPKYRRLRADRYSIEVALEQVRD